MKNLTLNLFVASILFLNSCGKEDIDTVKPQIILNNNSEFPAPCDTLHKGTEIDFNVEFSDNIELGSYSIDVHHNFDQHSHSTSVENCDLDTKKTAKNPWTYIKSYQIPGGLKEFTAKGKISVPSDIDPGDYHFLYKLTDKSGWQSIYGFSIKIID